MKQCVPCYRMVGVAKLRRRSALDGLLRFCAAPVLSPEWAVSWSPACGELVSVVKNKLGPGTLGALLQRS